MGYFFFTLSRIEPGINLIAFPVLSWSRILCIIFFDLYRIYKAPYPMKFTSIGINFYNYFSITFGFSQSYYKTWIILIFIGFAREVWKLLSIESTFPSLQFVLIKIKVFLTSSEIKELASRVFLIKRENIPSSSGSSILPNIWAHYPKAITAFLLREERKLSTNFAVSTVIGLAILVLNNSEWCFSNLLSLVRASYEFCQSYDFRSVWRDFISFSGSEKGLKP